MDTLLGPAQVRELAERLQLRPTKALGQNFVHDANTIRRIEAVDRETLQKLAGVYLKPETMTTLIVGDRAAIEPELKKLPDGAAIHYVDEDGKPAPPEKK